MRNSINPFGTHRYLDLWSVAKFGGWDWGGGGGGGGGGYGPSGKSSNSANAGMGESTGPEPSDQDRFSSKTAQVSRPQARPSGLRDRFESSAASTSLRGGFGPSGKSSNSANAGMGESTGPAPSAASSGGFGSSSEGPSDEDRFSSKTASVTKPFLTSKDFEPDLVSWEDRPPLTKKKPAPLPDIKIDSFDKWLKSQPKNTKSAGYETQHNAYKTSVKSQLKNNSGRTFANGDRFADYDPGLFKADSSYGNFSGGYRTKDDADSAFQDHYSGQIAGLGYGNLVQDGMSNEQYVNALTEATTRKKFSDLITGLGYQDTFDTGTSSDKMRSLWGDVQERKRYSTLLDDMGYEYDATDDATSLGYNYNQAVAIEDTKSKLEAARDQYSGLESTYASALGDMDVLQGDFDGLFGDYSSLTTDYGGLQGTYDELSGTYNRLEGTQAATKDSLAKKVGEYDALSGLYDTLSGNYGTQTTDYNDSISQLGDLQSSYDQLGDDKSALQGTYDDLFGSYGKLGEAKDSLQGEYDALTSVQGKTLADLDAERDAAESLRGRIRGNESSRSIADNDADFNRRLGSVKSPTASAYTPAMTALGNTSLDPTGYQISPIDFTGGFDPSIMGPTAMGGLADLGAYGTTDYTDIFAGPQMGLDQGGFDLNQSFNPYFEALNQEYGVETPPTNYGPRA